MRAELPAQEGDVEIGEDAITRVGSRLQRRDDVHSGRHTGDGVAADLVRGALAGVVATWVTRKVTAWMYRQKTQAVRARENAARDGKNGRSSLPPT